MLADVRVVLFEPKFPENVGSVARACLNMGVSDLVLVEPHNFDLDKALPLATAHAADILASARIAGTLAEALEGCEAAYGATARTGGWRRGIMSPATLAGAVHERLLRRARVALVFGPEDKGLTNAETALCTALCTIPTNFQGTSLNLAQAVVILLYECFRKALEQPFEPAHQPVERGCSVAERETLNEEIKRALLDVDFLREQDADYKMMGLRRLLGRIDLKRGEFNMLMGVCRQVRWAARKAGIAGSGGAES
ncbi:RNA methyltransferase [Paucidesulfovibrio longus]|uniref:RNA methyltransferase n=1 Tax=Paucidesulfovibrio longus TaxID=889 RepID=UPI0003B52DB2|nr:RNA methyltransferase [Paucidesulfovibrio longus]